MWIPLRWSSGRWLYCKGSASADSQTPSVSCCLCRRVGPLGFGLRADLWFPPVQWALSWKAPVVGFVKSSCTCSCFAGAKAVSVGFLGKCCQYESFQPKLMQQFWPMQLKFILVRCLCGTYSFIFFSFISVFKIYSFLVGVWFVNYETTALFCISVLLTVRCGGDTKHHRQCICILYSILGIGIVVAGIGAQQQALRVIIFVQTVQISR